MTDKIKKLERELDVLKTEIGQLQALVEIDFLTRLYNRHGFVRHAEGFLKELEWNIKNHPNEKRTAFPGDFLTIFIDLDNFKEVNDVYGHDVGDAVLQDVALFLRNNTKSMDIVARWSGDEFVAGLVGVSKKAGANAVERLRAKLSDHKIKFGGQTVKISASFGIVSAAEIYRDEGILDIYNLIEKTDEAMYEAKKNYGKNFVIDYHEIQKPTSAHAKKK